MKNYVGATIRVILECNTPGCPARHRSDEEPGPDLEAILERSAAAAGGLRGQRRAS
jgi:hypothetical protein